MADRETNKGVIKKQPDTRHVNDDEIRQIAYYLWLDEGCPDGRHHEHWLQAEELWHAQQATKPEANTGEPARAKSLARTGAKKPSAKAKSRGSQPPPLSK